MRDRVDIVGETGPARSVGGRHAGRWAAAALACVLGFLASPAALQARDATRADRARDSALLAFQSDLVSVLALRADAQPLLAAALLARPLRRQPTPLSFHALIERAAAAPGAGPAITWMRLADCDKAAANCPNAAAERQLLDEDADNAAPWLLKIGGDLSNADVPAARSDLARAAATTRYDDYFGASLAALATSVGTLPPPPATRDPAQAAGATATQLILVFGLANTQPRPALPIVAKLCADAADDVAVRASCLQLGKTLEWGSSPIARSLGLHLREELAQDPADRTAASRARLNLVWQVQRFNELTAQAPDDPALASRLLALARSGGTEMSIMLAALRDSGTSVDAPVGWKPPAAARQAAAGRAQGTGRGAER